MLEPVTVVTEEGTGAKGSIGIVDTTDDVIVDKAGTRYEGGDKREDE